MKTEEKVADFREDFPKFSQEMKEKYTILVPDMLPWHFDLITHVIGRLGYRLEVLHNEGRKVVDEGLKHVHNDACYPALCVIGQFLDALKSGRYDTEKTAVLITQTGGGCRASNYISLIRKALKAEFPNVPVLSVNFSGLEKGNGLQLSLGTILRLGYSIFYSDLVMTCYNQTRPYEAEAGASDAVRKECTERLKQAFDCGKHKRFGKLTREILTAFASVPRHPLCEEAVSCHSERSEESHEVSDGVTPCAGAGGNKGECGTSPKLKVGIVGEIYVKYSPLGNSHLEDFLLSEDCEPVLPALMDFVLYCVVNNINDAKLYGLNKGAARLYKVVYRWLYGKQKKMISIMKKQGVFEPLHDFERLRALADEVINQGVKMGEGWLIPAEMAALYETGTKNIVCAQPFGCLPNHIVGKGAVRTLKEKYTDINVVAVDYDPSATRVNQENRIKLMLATARRK